MIVVAGEALVDLIDEGGVLRPFPGGGPYNTAVALGRLGAPVAFLGRLSTDRFGRLLADELAASGVDGRYLLRSAAPTPLAVVHGTEDGGHEFGFYLTGTAYADLAPGDVPELGDDVAAVCAGTVALATDPPASAIEALLARESGRRLVVVDPNVRPAVCGDAGEYRNRFERWAEIAHVVKLSDDDAAWIYPGQKPEAVLELALARGARLAVLTLGGAGAVARTADARVQVAADDVEVVDTIGAGDAFVAGLVFRLWSTGLLAPELVGSLAPARLEDALVFAGAVAAIECTRAGAVPPSLAEVTAFLEREASPA